MTSAKRQEPTTKWADPSEVAAKIAEWTDAIIQCRIYGHGWAPHTLRRAVGGSALTVWMRCWRCRNRKWQDVDVNGFPLCNWHIIYNAEGYLTKDMGRIDQNGRALLRLASFRHQKVLEEEAD